MRSEPEGRAGSVRTARPPAAVIAAAISGSAAATITGPRPAATARSQTRTIMGRPAISARGLPGSRAEAMRAGINRIGFMRGSLGSVFRPSFRLKPAAGWILCDASPQ